MISFEITLETDDNGTLVCQKQKVHLLHSATILIAPSTKSEYYELESITVNGKDVTDEVKFNKLEVKYIVSDITVKATFRQGVENVKVISSAVFV